MQEYFEKYNSFRRIDTNPTIDNPIIVVLGLTISELAFGTTVFVLLGLVGDSPFIGITLGLLLAFLKKRYRKQFPNGFAEHLAWSSGFLGRRDVPRLFTFSRVKRLEP